VGALLLLATVTALPALVGGGLAVLTAIAAARLFELDADAVYEGSYGVSPLLLGLGVGQTLGLTWPVLLLLIGMSVLCVLVTAALRSLLGSSHLPPLSIPFLLIYYLVLGLAPLLGLAAVHPAAAADSSFVPAAAADFLRSVGSLLFLPRADAGALLLVALLLHSRIAVLLAGLAAATVVLLKFAFPPLAAAELMSPLIYNAIFTAIAIGGVWFVPSPSSILLALLGVFFCAVLTLGALGPFGRLGIPLLIVPFNFVVLTTLLAMRQRVWDRRPKSVDFTPGTPEQNLAYFRTRLLRFRWLYPTRFRLPVRGSWICTQGVDGPLSHRGQWRHAFDFEVAGSDSRFHGEQGTAARDFYCFRLPVLAAAGGIVAKVENTIADNELGSMNLAQNWGNYVIIYHGPGLYSMVAHLACGSVKVFEGQSVLQGTQLGLCGNSGRSNRPHLHFQLQSGNRPADPTLPCRFTDGVLVKGEREQVVADLCPQAGQLVRNLEYQEERATHFAFPYRTAWTFRVGRGREKIESDIDVNGQLLLRSNLNQGRLFYSNLDGFFTSYDSAGAATPALDILRAALSRIPLDGSESLHWTDYLPARQFRSRIGRLLSDIVSPFLHRDGIEMEYQMKSSGPLLIVTGRSLALDRRGEPLLKTRAELHRSDGPLRASITLRGKSLAMEREAEPAAAGDEAKGRTA
jgi:murein DD-endopeptidase MepM/ murein hydrolase activator NlpD/urea transporter